MTKDDRIAELEREVEELKQRWQKQKEEAYYEYIKLRNNFEEKDRQCFEMEEKNKHLRHEICEKIRSEFDNCQSFELSTYSKLCNVLDQIESGEE